MLWQIVVVIDIRVERFGEVRFDVGWVWFDGDVARGWIFVYIHCGIVSLGALSVYIDVRTMERIDVHI